MPIERELKFRLPKAHGAARVWRLLDARPRRRRLVSLYLDCRDGTLRQAHAALRLRRADRRWLQCFKADPPIGSLLVGRHEWEAAARGGRLRVGAFPLSDIQARTGIALAELEDRLRPLFETEFERATAELDVPGGRVEVALDRGSIAANGRRAPLREVEFELLEGDFLPLLERVRALIPELALELEVHSKAERGYQLASGEPEQPVKARRLRIDVSGEVRAAIGPVIGECISQAAANVHGIAVARDPEYLHQLRVGLRRLRSALRAFRDFSPPGRTQALVDNLHKVLPPLGQARDWEVVIALLEQRIEPTSGSAVDLAPTLRRAKRRRMLARRAAREVVTSSAFQQLFIDAMIWAEEAQRTGDGVVQAREAMPQLLVAFAKRKIARMAHKLEQDGSECDWSDAGARHRVRIRLKRVRYVCEFFAECFKRKRVKRYLSHVEALQDLLGELNDLATARRLFEELTKSDQIVQGAFINGWISAREDALIAALAQAWAEFREQAHPA